MNLAIQANEDDFYEWQVLADAESEFDFINVVTRMVSDSLNIPDALESKIYLAVVLALFVSFIELLESEEKAVVMNLIAENPERDPESPRTILMADLLREFPEFHPAILQNAATRINSWELADILGHRVSPLCLKRAAHTLILHSKFLEHAQQHLLSNALENRNQ
jgi:hypothetical protein